MMKFDVLSAGKKHPWRVLLLLFFLVYACDSAGPETEDNPPEEEPPPLTECRPAPARPPGFEAINLPPGRPAEQLQHRLSDADPQFAGIYISDEGLLTLAVAGNGKQTSAGLETAVRQELESGLLRALAYGQKPSGADIQTVAADFTFRELAAWRETVTARVLGSRRFPHVISSFIDEAENRVMIGIDARHFHAGSVGQLRQFASETLGIPETALGIFADQPDLEDGEWDDVPEPAFRTAAVAVAGIGLSDDGEDASDLSGSIQARQRPLVGGLRIRFGSSSLCTMGFFGTAGEREVMVTNAHCSVLPHRTGSTIYWQGARNNDDDEIGIELDGGDPTMEACVEMNDDCWPCKWSDAALVQLNAEVPRLPENIAKTIAESTDWMTNGSLIIDTDDPVFTVVGLETSLIQGMEVHKVGGNSGWGSGPVTRTCYDSRRSSHGFILQCQNRARYSTDGGGTSGSPVFVRLPQENHPDVPNPVAIAGIHWGSSARDTPGGYSAFSPLSGILTDLPLLEVARVTPPASAALRAD